MKINGKLTIRQAYTDYYVIEHAVHDGSHSVIEVDGGGRSHFGTSWISPAIVEGNSEEMLEIANAITKRGRFNANRCAVMVNGDRAFFWSPRNSHAMGWKPEDGDCRGRTTLEVADALADLIKSELEEK